MRKGLVTLSLILVSLSSRASSWIQYDEQALDLATRLTLCPHEVSKLISQPHTRVTKAEAIGGETADGSVRTEYTVTFTQTFPAPSFSNSESVLVMTVVRQSVDIPAADHPGYTESVNCEIRNSK